MAALAAIRQAIEADAPGILGLHLEGPFLSPERPGIHPREAIRQITSDDLAAMTAGFPGALLVTLAPEEAPAGAIERLARHGVIVFAGHSAATSADMAAAQGDGLSGATHLFNAMSQITVREPGVTGAVLSSDNLFAGIIVDGHHVDWANVSIAARLMPDRLCLVTDAMCTLAGSVTEFEIRGERIALSDGRLSSADGTLAGAHIAMDELIKNVIDRGIASPSQAIRMATLNPARAMRMESTLGTIREGNASGITSFDQDWNARRVIHGSLRSLAVRQSSGGQEP